MALEQHRYTASPTEAALNASFWKSPSLSLKSKDIITQKGIKVDATRLLFRVMSRHISTFTLTKM